jgi:crossover junction endodeoxyribonuclease RuvC
VAPLAKSSAGRAPREVILGIDPGSIHTGWGVVESVGSELRHIAHGTISPVHSLALGARLSEIRHGLQHVIERHRPGAASLEKVFFARNVQSALKLGQARGVALLTIAENPLALAEYSATEIKIAVVGYGQATKEQVQKMVSALLGLRGPIVADAADALAAAICHIHRRAFQGLVQSLGGDAKASGSWRNYLNTVERR